MEQRVSRSARTKSSERESYHAGFKVGRKASTAAPNFSTDAYNHLRERTKSSKVDLCSTSSDDSITEEDSFSCELQGRSCKKVVGTPMKKFTDEVVSTSVIARLMGLDEMTSPQTVSKLKNETGHSFFKKSFSGLGEKHEGFGNHSLHVDGNHYQKFKIAHELYDYSKDKKHTDLAFITQQFMEENPISTNKACKKPKEFSHDLDILDASKDIFLKFLQEPNSLFAKHYRDLRHSKSFSHTNHFKNFVPSAGNFREKSEKCYRSMGKNKEHTQKMKASEEHRTKLNSSLGRHSMHDLVDSPFPALLRSQYTRKTDASPHPSSTFIRVQKMLSAGRTESSPRSLQNYELGYKRHKEFHRELLVEIGEQHRLYDVKTKTFMPKAANYIFSDISEQIKQSSRKYSEEASKSNQFDSSSYLGKPSPGRATMNTPSNQWKATDSSQQKLFGDGSCPVKENSRTFRQPVLKNKSDKKVDEKDAHHSRAHFSGLNSFDEWKYEHDAFTPRLEDHLNSSAICEALKLDNNGMHNSVINRERCLLRNALHHNNKRQTIRSYNNENKIPVSGSAEACQNELKNMININNVIEPKPFYLQRKMDGLLHMVYDSSISQNLDSDKSFLTNLRKLHLSEKFDGLPVFVLDNEVHELALDDGSLVESPLDVIREAESFAKPKIAERLSPVSVLDPPSEDWKSIPKYLENLSVILQDLQKQLKLLELETADSSDEQHKLLVYNDKTAREILISFKNGGERDFMYLLDVLNASGLYAVSQNKFFDACNSPDNPVFPDVFDKLEREHNSSNLWLRSERKLLFDHINSILAEVLAPCIDLHPWVKSKRNISCGHGRLVAESWRLFVQQGKELSRGKPEEKVLDTRWLHLADHVDMIGREIEKMLKDDLLNELVSELVFGTYK